MYLAYYIVCLLTIARIRAILLISGGIIMDVLVRLTVPNYVYRFYKTASEHIAKCTAEDIMADALSAYAGMLSEEVSRERERAIPQISQED